ncbi:MAG: DUF2127 domain-containing protein [Chloroflexi bacterium]|nr:DUF2127 domain-containing protein [Ktedonobacteraceae bacterium]MBV8823196.1 DUF2127 domain-containing protein [Ktedonobacteraceae bacterium]MBV9021125.1 DUF2127 domain-containing protein [Ktedonobacteraceae bacterium]MBV9706937.1 DUF2127 domain-containing protein [Chloroflexota bacterium]
MQETVSRKRPLGVTIVAAVLSIEGIVEIIIGIIALLAIFALGRVAATHGHNIVHNAVDVIGIILGGYFLIAGILKLIFAVGLWALQRWAFWLTVIIEVISILGSAYQFTRPGHNVVGIVLGMIIPVLILLYFFVDSNVRAAFRI